MTSTGSAMILLEFENNPIRIIDRDGEPWWVLAEVCREWDAFKAGLPQTAAQRAAREWLVHNTASQLTLAQVLAGAFEPAIGTYVKPSEAARYELAAPDPAATREPAMSSEPLFGVNTAPPIGSLGKAIESLISSESATGTARFGSVLGSIGTIAKAMEGLLPSQGNARAAAGEISRLAELLADATEKSEAGDTAVAPTRKKSDRQVNV